MRGLYFLLPCASWSLYVWPGTSSLQYGYNILKGSPASGGADPGWSSKAFSNPNCDFCFVGGSTIDGGYSVPAGISVSHSSYCAYNSSTITVQDAASWSQAGASSIAPNPDYPGPFGGLYYSSSASTQRVSTLTTNGMASLMVAAGECDTHTISLDAGHYTWQLSQDILEGLQSLPPLSPTPAVQQAYATFVESFGTHVPDSVTLGAYAVQETLFTAASFSLLQSASDSLAATASLSLLVFFGASLSSADTRAQSDYLLFAASLSSNTTACRPACPPVSPSTSYDPGQWAATLGYPPPGGPNTNTTATLIAPAPVRATLIPITTALLSSLRGMEAAAAAARAASTQPSGLSTTALATALRATQDLASFLNTSYCALLPACSPPTTSPHLALAPLPLLPTGLSAPAAAVLGGVGESAVLLIAGGEVGCTSGSSTTPPLASPATYLADLSQPGGGWTRKDDMPLGMGVAYGANIPVNATTVLIAGGWSGSSSPGTPSNSTLFFNVDSGAWSAQVGGLGVGGARAGAAWAVFGGVLVLLGGTQDGISPTNTTACVSLSTGLNQACPPSLPSLLPTPLVGGAAITIPSPFTPGAEMLVIAGGCPSWAGTFPFAAPTSCPTPSAAVFYAESTGTGGAWHTLSPLPQPAVGLALLVEHAPPSSLSSSSSQYIGAAAPSQLPNFGGGGGEGGGVTALWALGGGGVARFLFDLGGWQPLPWSDPWSAGFGAMVQQQQGEGGELWRLGGCNASGSLPLIVEVTGRLSLN